jgi:hypothetical protein
MGLEVCRGSQSGQGPQPQRPWTQKPTVLLDILGTELSDMHHNSDRGQRRRPGPSHHHKCEAPSRSRSPDDARTGRRPGPRNEPHVRSLAVLSDYRGRLRRASDGTPGAGHPTPENITADLLAIDDAANADIFACYGYSWLALCGLQLAIRTNRLWALIMGGYPPLDGPYKSMLAVTKAAHSMAAGARQQAPTADTTALPGDWDAVMVQANEQQTRQFVTLYEALQGFDDSTAAVARGLPLPAQPIKSITDPDGEACKSGSVHHLLLTRASSSRQGGACRYSPA